MYQIEDGTQGLWLVYPNERVIYYEFKGNLAGLVKKQYAQEIAKGFGDGRGLRARRDILELVLEAYGAVNAARAEHMNLGLVSGIARCSEQDIWNVELGKVLAKERATLKMRKFTSRIAEDIDEFFSEIANVAGDISEKAFNAFWAQEDKVNALEDYLNK